MKTDWSHLEKFRMKAKDGPFTSPAGAHYGAFQIRMSGESYAVIADDGCGNGGDRTGWEHVSVRALVDPTLRMSRIPTWRELCLVKNLFWYEDEVVLQFMVDGPQKINIHPCVLHLWRPVDGKFPMPDSKMV